MTYHIEFWQGAERSAAYDDAEYLSPEDAREHINDLLAEIITDTGSEDWTGCRFEVVTGDGRMVLQVPVLLAMSAIARRTSH